MTVAIRKGGVMTMAVATTTLKEKVIILRAMIRVSVVR
jgi:hypothetical protein